MKLRRFYSLPYFLLLSAVILTVQLGALLHGVRHPFHAPTDTCKSYIVAEQQGHALLSLHVPVVPQFVENWQYVVPVYQVFPRIILAFSARAPPLSS